MSDAVQRRLSWEAQADAEKLFMLLGRGNICDRWMVAGSLRRNRAKIGDVDHVLIPRFGPDPGSLFAGEINMLLKRLDDLLAGGVIRKALKNGVSKWGEINRRLEYPPDSGHVHDIYLASPANWGSVLAVRTGPFDYSKMLVTVMKMRGYECRDGFYVYQRGTEKRIDVPDEKQFITEICGQRWLEPWERKL